LRSLQEIQPDFEEEAKAYAGLWSQRNKKERKKINRCMKISVSSNFVSNVTQNVRLTTALFNILLLWRAFAAGKAAGA
jgi:hypothetical protein